jgi:hypothetical protein
MPRPPGARRRSRLITRGGYNLTDRYPWIVEAARKIRQRRFVLDGEAVVIGVDGVSAGNFWFPYFRLFAPTQAYFDRSWPLPDVEKVT